MKRVTLVFEDDIEREEVEDIIMNNGMTVVIPEYPVISDSEINILIPDEWVSDAEDEDE
jgi:hypothetical protein